MARMVEAIRSFPRTRIVTREEPYLHAEFRSPVFRFTDDVELLQEREEQLFHIRSASRVGYSDLGANRKRVERIREEFQQKERR
jgi:uncharacterized protein (DUF1499 family)